MTGNHVCIKLRDFEWGRNCQVRTVSFENADSLLSSPYSAGEENILTAESNRSAPHPAVIMLLMICERFLLFMAIKER